MPTFDNTIARACLRAARLAKLNYGQANGWTCHSLRNTFITHHMKVIGNDVGTVMKYSGHKHVWIQLIVPVNLEWIFYRAIFIGRNP